MYVVLDGHFAFPLSSNFLFPTFRFSELNLKKVFLLCKVGSVLSLNTVGSMEYKYKKMWCDFKQVNTFLTK
jgi:hypothetical protein